MILLFAAFPARLFSGDNILPELEIDENENSQKILDIFFEAISTDWTALQIMELRKRENENLHKTELEFNVKLKQAETRLFELEHLIAVQPREAPYFASFYFRQLVDLKNSFENICVFLENNLEKSDSMRKQIKKNLEMVQAFDIKAPELQWQKNWIRHHVLPIIEQHDSGISHLKKMLAGAGDFRKKSYTVFKREEENIQRNYEKYYCYRFNFLGNLKGRDFTQILKMTANELWDWRFSAPGMFDVIMPNQFGIEFLFVLLAVVILFAGGGFFLYRWKRRGFLYFLKPYIFFGLGFYLMLCVLMMSSTNDIIIFTVSGFFIGLALIDLAWKLRKLEMGMEGINPFLPLIPFLVLIDVFMSLLLPVGILLAVLVLESFAGLVWISFVFFRYRYKNREFVFSALLCGGSWLAAGTAAWLGYLYPSLLIMVISAFMVTLLYCGSVFTQFLVGMAGKIAQKQLLVSFVFTLLIPLMWLLGFMGALIWGCQIFNAGRILQLVYTADLVPGVNIRISLEKIVFLFLTVLLIKFFLRWIRYMMELFTSERQVDKGSLHSAFLIFQYSVWVIFIACALNSLSIDWGNIKYILGGLSVGFGFALKDLLENFVCGIILLIGKEVRPGDVVEFDGTWGTVENINIRATFIKTFDNAMISLPNLQVVSKEFKNWTLNNHILRRQIDVGVQYGSNVEKVIELLLESANRCELVLHLNEPNVLFMDFGESALIFRLRFWVVVDNAAAAPSIIRGIITKLFDENGIVIAYPQLDVHFDSRPELSPGAAPAQSASRGNV